MNNFEEARQAKELVARYWTRHPLRCRRVGAIGIGLVDNETANEDGDEHQFSVHVGITDYRMTLPPKFAPHISKVLEEAGLEHIPVTYRHEGMAVAQATDSDTL